MNPRPAPTGESIETAESGGRRGCDAGGTRITTPSASAAAIIAGLGIGDTAGPRAALAEKATPADIATPVTNALAGKQPLDAGLSAIAALATAAFGRPLPTLASLGAASITPTGGTRTTRGDILAGLDPTATGFQAAQSRVFAA